MLKVKKKVYVVRMSGSHMEYEVVEGVIKKIDETPGRTKTIMVEVPQEYDGLKSQAVLDFAPTSVYLKRSHALTAAINKCLEASQKWVKNAHTLNQQLNAELK